MGVNVAFQNESLFHGPMVFGATPPVAGDIVKTREELSGEMIFGGQPIYTPPNTGGRGYRLPQFGQTHQGREGAAGSFSGDLTDMQARDFMLALWQGNITDNTTYYSVGMSIDPDPETYMYLAGLLRRVSDQFTGWEANACVPTTFKINVPSSEGNTEGSRMTWDADVIGRNGVRLVAVPSQLDYASNTVDNQVPYLGHDALWTIDGTARNTLSGNIMFTSGWKLSPESNADGTAFSPRIIGGAWTYEGEVVVWLASGEAADDLRAAFEANTHTDIKLTLDATTHYYDLPCVVKDPGKPTEVAGGYALTCKFFGVISDDGTTKIPDIRVPKVAGGTSESQYYVA